ncbi:Arc family DNA binding domain-containing protein [Morganella morganii]|uniref:Arc family DNA binding domain-containing protein n=1 Tax=Morganella morganii TaxID=582 RepID=UPI0023DD69E3|nr:Arc family DNA binding domain-containing protein [Morganella morganii]
MQKAKEMSQRRIRFPDELCKLIEENGGKESRQFNTEVIYQLRKAYGLLGKAAHEMQ